MNLEQDYSGDYFQLYSIKKEFLLDLSELKLKQKIILVPEKGFLLKQKPKRSADPFDPFVSAC